MTETYSTALTLMAVGMITVFLVLFLVVLFGQLLIRVINRYFSEETQATSVATTRQQYEIAPNKVAAIVAAVNHYTEGQGNITEIKKTQ